MISIPSEHAYMCTCKVTLIAYPSPGQRWSSWHSTQSVPLMCKHWGGPPCSPPPTPAGAGFASLSPWRPCALGSGPPHWMPLPHNGYQSQSIDQPTHVYTRTCTCMNIIRLGYKYMYIIHECITNKHDSRCLAGHSILPTNYHLAAV